MPLVMFATVTGAVVSIFTATVLAGALVLPATSFTVAAALVYLAWAVNTWSAGQAPASPGPPVSAQVKWTVTAWLVQAPETYGLLSAVVALAEIVGSTGTMVKRVYAFEPR